MWDSKSVSWGGVWRKGLVLSDTAEFADIIVSTTEISDNKEIYDNDDLDNNAVNAVPSLPLQFMLPFMIIGGCCWMVLDTISPLCRRVDLYLLLFHY